MKIENCRLTVDDEGLGRDRRDGEGLGGIGSLGSLGNLGSYPRLLFTLYARKAHSPTRCAPPTPRVHIAEQMQGLRSARKRSLLKVNEHFERKRNAADAREVCSQRVGFAWGFLCQTSEHLRSLLGANEEVAMRSLVQKAPAKHTRPRHYSYILS